MAGIALKSAENKGFPRALVLKNGGLGRFPNRRFVVGVSLKDLAKPSKINGLQAASKVLLF